MMSFLKPLAGVSFCPVESSASKVRLSPLCGTDDSFRDELQKYLTEAGIGTGIHYPIPIHLQAAYASRGWKRGDFPKTEAAADEILSLPMFAGLTADQQKQVAEKISQFALSSVAR